MMKLSQRIHLLLKTAVNDLFGEDQLTEVRQMVNGENTAEHLTILLNDAQRQLDSLRLELNQAASYEKRIQVAWQQAATQIQVIDKAVDAAIQAGDDGRAHAYLTQLNAARQHESELAELAKASEKHCDDLRAAVSRQQEQLDTLKRRALALTDRERSVSALSELLSDQQSLTRQTEQLHNELTVWEEQIARREDLLSARREWNQ